MFKKLNQNLIVTLVVAICGLSLFAIASADNNETIRGGKLTIEHPTQSPRFSISALRTTLTNEFTSEVINTDLPFNAISFSWEQPTDSKVTLQARFQKETWSDWRDTELDGDLMENSKLDATHPVTALIFTPYTNIFQYRFIFANNSDRSSISNLTASYIDSTRGNKAVYQVASEMQQGLTVIPRSQWGADESFRYDSAGEKTWPEDFYIPKRFIIHHTDSSDVSNPLATLRAIYYFHTKTHDWGDIGYNYLIDNQGNIYEGRAGGDAVVGAHAFMNNQGSIGIAILGCYQPGAKTCNSPEHLTPETEAALQKLISVKSQQFGINPNGMSPTYDRGMQPTVIGHRDVGHTNCPGDRVYTELSSIKSTSSTALSSLPALPNLAIGAQISSSKVASVNVPSDSTSEVIVKFKNTGEAVWRGYQDDHLLLGTDVKKLGMINKFHIAQVTPTIKTGFKLLEGNVKPGEIGTFKITVRPNDGVKTYTLAWLNKGYIENTDVTITAIAVAGSSNTYVTPIISGSLVSSTLPENLLISDSADAQIVIINTGNITWNKEKLKLSLTTETGTPSPLVPNAIFTPEETEILPGQNATFKINLIAPDTYAVIRHLVSIVYDEKPVTSFSSQTMIVTEFSAAIVSSTIPESIVKNRAVPISITIKNIGTKEWKGFQLKSTDPKGYESALYHKTWNARKIISANKKTVKPGEEVTITVKFWAPNKAGNTTQLYKLWTGKQVIILNGQEVNQRTTKITK